MKEKNLFSEQQKFQQPWGWIVIFTMFGVSALFVWGVIRQVVQGHPWGNQPMSNTGLLVCTIFVFLLSVVLTIVLIVAQLETSVSANGISFRFYPIHRSFRIYKWDDIAEALVKKFSPFGIKGGMGIRFTGRTTIYMMTFNAFGNSGLHLVLKSGRRLIIGTQRAKELEHAIEKAKQTINHIK